MTGREVCARYQIPMKVLQEYERWGLCGAVRMAMEDWHYDDQDLERLSLIMALHDMEFSTSEVETYMKFLLAGDSTRSERIRMLEKRRSKMLDEIHLRERQLARMDYLRHEIRKDNGQTN